MGLFSGGQKEKPVPRIVRAPDHCGKVFDIFIDTKTGVNYLRYKYEPITDKAAGGLTVMYDGEGKVLVSTQKEIHEAIANFKTNENNGLYW